MNLCKVLKEYDFISIYFSTNIFIKYTLFQIIYIFLRNLIVNAYRELPVNECIAFMNIVIEDCLFI